MIGSDPDPGAHRPDPDVADSEDSSGDRYRRLTRRLQQPVSQPVRSSAAGPSPPAAEIDPDWPVPVEPDEERAADWILETINRCAEWQAPICAAVAAELAVEVWDEWVRPHMELYDWWGFPKSTAATILEYACRRGWRPTVRDLREPIGALRAILLDRPIPLTVGEAPLAVLDSLDAAIDAVDGMPRHSWHAVRHAVRAHIWGGMTSITSTRADRREQTLRTWWTRCRARLPMVASDHPAE